MSAQTGGQAAMQSAGTGTEVHGGVVSPQTGSAMGQQPMAGASTLGMAMQGSLQRGEGAVQGGSTGAAEGTVMPVIAEELRVGKREVQRGGVRIFQRMVETPVSETVNLREEHVSVERRAVDQPVSAAELANFQEKSIELRETAEEPVVEKSARVVEEVVVGKQVTQTQQEITDTVRHTEVEVEQLSGATGSSGLTGSGGMSTGGTGAGLGAMSGTTAGEMGAASDTGMNTGVGTGLGSSMGTGMGTAMGTGTGMDTGMDGSALGTAGSDTSSVPGTDDNDYFRKHYDANYGTSGRSYQDYMPAYSYGSTMAATDHYRGRSWTDAEPALRQDWESRNPGSTWDNFKAAVQHGWQKITG
jgi:uncharacterized protein (TIGR02271 family)